MLLTATWTRLTILVVVPKQVETPLSSHSEPLCASECLTTAQNKRAFMLRCS